MTLFADTRSATIDADSNTTPATNVPGPRRATARRPARTTLGWREWVSFPDHGVPWVKAKVDTGARTSSLHAFDVEVFARQDRRWVHFTVEPWQRSDADPIQVEAPIHDERWVRSSSGDQEHRPVILVPVTIAGVTHEIELTLAHRPQMGFRMLLGRQALRGYYQVDPGRSYLGGRPPKSIRRRNRGRPVFLSGTDPAESP